MTDDQLMDHRNNTKSSICFCEETEPFIWTLLLPGIVSKNILAKTTSIHGNHLQYKMVSDSEHSS